MTSVETVDRLVQGFIDACKRENCEIELDPVDLLRTVTKSSTLLSAITMHGSQRKVEVPRKTLNDWGVDVLRGLYVRNHSHYAVQIGLLDTILTPGEWQSEFRDQLTTRWHTYQQLAAIARTWLITEYSDDLNLFLIGPPGSAFEQEWINFAQEIERNDLVCRKLVWLPSKNESTWGKEIAAIMMRCFLSKPWTSVKSTSNVSLDSVSDLASTLGEWSEIFDDPAFASDDPTTLVALLIERFGR